MAQGGSAGVAEDEEVVDVDGLFNFATAPRQNQTNSPRATQAPSRRPLHHVTAPLQGVYPFCSENPEEHEAQMEYTLARTVDR